MGTPKTLSEAIENGICNGPMKDVRKNLHDHIRDFLAQRFSTAMLDSAQKPFSEDDLKKLFEKIVA